MDKAPVRPVQRAQGGGRHAVDFVRLARRVAVGHDAGLGLQPAGQHVEQRGLAGAAFAHDGQDLAGPQLGIHTVQRRTAAVMQAQPAGAEQGVAHAARSRRVAQ